MKEGQAMRATNMVDRLEVPAAPELREVMPGKVVTRGDEEYSRVRQIWIGAVQHQPALFAVCENASDVQSAVRSARAHRLPLAVSSNLAPHWLPDGYPNMLGPDDYEQTAHSYGADTGRLQRVERLVDPDGVFTSAISLPLQRAA
jgi:FAD/FMN-containing dehydrogenase